ncbi:sensor histidine kinase [Jannaschia sp. CCS1]|uniref:sensor histidine kinase n=1 Tax=Jannaschia sp. (strain CCS1) TaxID=290400 RepID=UPI000053A5AA|nr:ATP-binding protein [Jannaschia sp. CCS1]ABD55205.1 histidine kinase [Jannaschia sp. CCS1]
MTYSAIHSLIDAVPDPMVLIAPDGTIGHANAGATALFGGWIIGRSHGLALRHPALLEQIDAVRSGEASAKLRIERSEQAGVTQYKVRISALTGGAAGALVLHFTDITHLRETEEMRRDFVANVSHELRTPLTSVMGFIETLRGPARNDPAAQDRFLGIMEAEAGRMNRLISDLLSLSKVEAAERKRPTEQVDLAVLLEEVIAALRPRADDAGNRLELIHDDAPALVRGDHDQLMQVFLNLAENALKYGGPGQPVTLRLSRGQGGGINGRAMIRVDVTDQGPGIDSQHLPRLTERFYRVDAHRSREMGGTGLGLAIVKHIVNRHRGRLKITSQQGHGSTFSVQLPVE